MRGLVADEWLGPPPPLPIAYGLFSVSFKPRTSSGLAVNEAISIDSDDEVTTPEVTPSGSSRPAAAAADDLTTPPRPAVNGHKDTNNSITATLSSDASVSQLSSSANETIRGDNSSDDDDLSDPPPLGSPVKDKPKKLTKKRPSTAGPSTGTVKKAKKADGPRQSTSSAKGDTSMADSSSGGIKVARTIAAPGEGNLCHHHRQVCKSELLRCTCE